MTKKGDGSMFSAGLRFSLLVTGMALGVMACSDSAADGQGTVDGTMSGSVGATSTGTMTATGSGTTTGSTATATSTTMTGTTTAGTTGTGGATSSTTGTTGGTSMGGTGTATSAGGMGTSAGGAGMAAGGASTTGMGGTTSATGAGGTAGNAGEDLDMTAEDFSCIADWDQVLGFRITNLLGHLDEALAVAASPNGGVYPVGTIIQHLPTEAMVKRATGFSPETRDWEFFLLELSPEGVTTILERGTTEIMTMGETCASCHSQAPAQWDFICNTWGNEGSGNCGFDFMESFLAMQLAGDTRCE